MPIPRPRLVKDTCPHCKKDEWQELGKWHRRPENCRIWQEFLTCRGCKKTWTRVVLIFRQSELDEAHPLPPETQFSFDDMDVGTQESEDK